MVLFATLIVSISAYSQMSFADLSFSEEFGNSGTDDDEFDKPADLAINNNGDKLYVADTENNRIKIYELTNGDNCSSGNDEIINDEVCFDDDFGSPGSNTGRFDIPTDLAVSKDNGDIYVVDSDNNRVQKFESDGDYDNLEFGSDRSNDDEYLGTPSAIAIDRESDYIYVADTTTDSISVFDKDGDFKFNFGRSGSSDDEFDNPSGMVIDDSNQMLYVADTDNNRIKIYELTDGDNCPSGTDEVENDEVCFVDDFGSSGSGDGRFNEPAGLTYDEDNDLLYVADTENNRIQVFEIISGNNCPSGTDEIIDGVCFVEEFGSSGSTDGRFNSPSGLAIDENSGILYVADTDNNRIQMLSVTGGSSSDTLSFSDKFGSSGNDEDEFDKPADLAINNNGDKLYVADSENNRIKTYELTNGDNCSSGNDEIINDEVCFDDDFGSPGSNTGRFDIPTDLAVSKDNGDIYVVDSDNNRVQRFNSNGNYDNLEFGSDRSNDDEYLGTPSAIAIDRKSDYIYVADTARDSISVFDKDGDFKFKFEDDGSNDDFTNPSGMVIDDSNQILYVADTDNNRIRIFELTDGDNCPSGTDEVENDEVCFVDDFGSSGSTEGKFDKPKGLTYDDDNDLLYVADTDNNRIQVFEIISGNNCPSGTDEIIDGVCFVEEFGSSGSTDGRFNSPSGLAIDLENGILYVADTDNNRIQMLSVPSGTSSSSSNNSSSSSGDEPNTPTGLRASAASTSSIIVTWDVPDPDDNDPKITGYKIEAREGSDSYETLYEDTESTVTSFLHTGLDDSENYRYKVSAINSEGTSSAATSSSAKPGPTQAPSGVTAVAISKNQILLNWIAPTETFKQSISGYVIEREIISDVLYDEVKRVSGSTTKYTVSGLEEEKEYSYVITANFAVGNSPRSESASATPDKDAESPTSSTTSSSSSSSSNSDTVPSVPRNLNAVATSSQISLTWNEPSSDGNSKITGYKVEVKKNSGSYTTLESSITSRSYVDSNVDINSTYTYRVSAINSEGTGVGATDSATPKTATLEISPIGQLNIDEKKTLTFTVKITDSSIRNVAFSLASNAPSGAKISSNTGLFTWSPTDSQGGRTYTFDIKADNGSMTDSQSITITVNDVITTEPPEPPKTTTEPPEPPKTDEPKDLGLASFVDETKDPQHYVDRYNNEDTYKKWFDDNYPEYSSIYQAVGLDEPVEAPAFVDPNQDPQYYVDRYNSEASYKKWFDDNYPEYSSIYQAVGLEEPTEIEDSEPEIGQCGPGTELVDGKCELVEQPGGGCLIATAAYGSEMSPQVQFLREIRDSKVMSTESGASFMTGFNSLYYSFSPYIADYERENPIFKEMVKIGITPMLSTLSIMSFADTESEIMGYGIGVILMNLGIYVAAPAAILFYGINKARRKVRF